MRETRLPYTPDGLPARTTYPGAKWKELVYDDARNVTNILHTARSTPNTSFLHDAFGNITNATDTAGNSWQFSYASLNILTNEVFTSPRLCDSACQINALSRLVDTYSRPVGYDLIIDNTLRSRVRYGYDAEGRIATLAATNTANRGFQVFYNNESGYNYGYTLTTPNGATLTRTVTRDPYRRSLTLDCTTRFNSVEVASFAYSFDAHNRPISRNNDRFAYNDRDEILSAMIGTNRIEHAYDTIGNHVFCAFNSATNFYANNQLNQTTASYLCAPTSVSGDATPQDDATPPLFDGYDILSTNKFTWSVQGGLQRDGRFIYAFDAEDQLTSVTSSRLTNGAIRVENKYDYRHRRISKTVYRCVVNQVQVPAGSPPSPVSTTLWNVQERHDFVYDDWNLIHETVTAVDANSTTNVTEIEYFWGPDLSNTLQGAGGVGGLLAVSMNGVFYFPVYDNLGNVVQYLDESGTIVASYIYDDFGQMIEKTGSFVSYFPFLFSTKYFDREIDIYYYGYRFYSPELHSWLNRDPIAEKGGNNIYGILNNDMLSFFDYLGEDFGYLGPNSGPTGEISLVSNNPEPGKDAWFAVFGDESFNVRRRIRYHLRMCNDKKKVSSTYDYYSELKSYPYYWFGNAKQEGRLYYAEVLSLDVPVACGSIDVEIQLLPTDVKPPRLKPLGVHTQENKSSELKSSQQSLSDNRTQIEGFGTENARYGDATSTRRLVNYDLSGLNWSPPRNYASVRFTMVVDFCKNDDGSPVMLKNKLSLNGNWRLKEQRWKRLWGPGQSPRMGSPMPMLEDCK